MRTFLSHAFFRICNKFDLENLCLKWCSNKCVCQAQQQAMHLARLHQKHNSLSATSAAAAAASSMTPSSSQTSVSDATASVAPAPAASTRLNNAPVIG